MLPIRCLLLKARVVSVVWPSTTFDCVGIVAQVIKGQQLNSRRRKGNWGMNYICIDRSFFLCRSSTGEGGRTDSRTGSVFPLDLICDPQSQKLSIPTGWSEQKRNVPGRYFRAVRSDIVVSERLHGCWSSASSLQQSINPFRHYPYFSPE